MDPVPQSDSEQPRVPTFDDLTSLCHELNARGARYVIIGGLAMVRQGFVRATEDIDLLIDRSRENQRLVRKALEILPDQAVKELEDSDLDEFVVVRIADEIIVDLMLSACGVSYAEAAPDIEWHEVQGVRIPFASRKLLLRLKQGVREKDQIDRQWLERNPGSTKPGG